MYGIDVHGLFCGEQKHYIIRKKARQNLEKFLLTHFRICGRLENALLWYGRLITSIRLSNHIKNGVNSQWKRTEYVLLLRARACV